MTKKSFGRTQVAALLENSFLRFFTASLAGLVFDIALAAMLHHVLGLPLIGAAAISLMVAAAAMYVVHEFWTFRSTSAATFSTTRLVATLVSAGLALFTRAACLYITGEILGFGERYALIQLAGATGLSFVVNYLLVRRILARSPARRSARSANERSSG